jgi:hypothetical protein
MAPSIDFMTYGTCTGGGDVTMGCEARCFHGTTPGGNPAE